MGVPTRFPNGVTNRVKANPLGQFLLPDPTSVHAYFEDFDYYTAADWTVTEVGVATQALTDIDGGALLVTNAAADNDSSFSQKVGESFRFASGKKLWFKTRFKVSDATQSDVVIGLQITDTTPLDVTDGVFFLKDDGDTNIDFHVEKNNTATSSTAIGTLADDTFIELAIYYDGKSEITAYVDGLPKATVATTNMPDDEDMTISFGIQNGEAVAKTMTVDYILAAKER